MAGGISGEDRAFFRRYHRAGRAGRVLRRLAAAAVAVVVLTGALFSAASAQTPTPSPSQRTLETALPLVAVTPSVPASPPTSATTVSPTASAATASKATRRPSSTPAVFAILITATGWQAEIDRCQWVRMDMQAAAPIVGAHTSCGGRIVLTMRIGDTVTLRGQGLDGRYQVTGSRDAHIGDNAAAATAGVTAAVILQTCYTTRNAVRLVSLALVS